jgi:hypothetical protein
LNFDYHQDTKQADHAGQKPLFGVNYRFCNTDIWVKKVSSLLLLAFLPAVFLVKPFTSPFFKCYSKNHNAVFSEVVWEKYPTQSVG